VSAISGRHFPRRGGLSGWSSPGENYFANAEPDASRRDFTVKWMFYDPITQKIHDWIGGEKDPRAKIIRTSGAPEEPFWRRSFALLRAVLSQRS